MPRSARGVLTASLVSLGVLTAAAYPAAAFAAPPVVKLPATAGQPARGVIVMLRDQHKDLKVTRSSNSPRALADRKDQAPLLSRARSAGFRDLHGFSNVNAFAGTATAAQIAALTADPSVAAVFPDLPITKTPVAGRPEAAAATRTSPATSKAAQICPTDPSKPLLEPEALQTTNTAFGNPATPQAQSLATGAGVKVAWLADGIDINNPDFVRADGSHVFVDYKDFSEEGPDAPSSSAEAFGDASSIAAQGRQVYDLSTYVNPAHPLPAGCTITVRGIAPGASLVGLKVFGAAPTAPTSRFIEALDYAVNVAGVDVINESFGSNPFPDLGNDPISLADDAAVDAGVTVVASTGDAGLTGTVGSPASSAKVISVAASTTFRSYLQEGYSGARDFSNGTWASGNISQISSGGVTQRNRVPDLAAPGDLGWALCTPNPDVYVDCTDDKGDPASLQNFGGTSQASPFTAGAAALVIEAYKRTHGGDRPTPDLVKRLLTSTATDLGYPASQQGAGQLDTLGAVRAALSFKDGNGAPQAQGTSLVVDRSQLSVAGQPGHTVTSKLGITNVSRNTQTVRLSTRTLGKATSTTNGTVTLNSATAPTFVDSTGIVRSYVIQKFTVGVGADRLDFALTGASAPGALKASLIDPHGTFTSYTFAQGAGNWGHTDVHYPAFGTWTAIIFITKAVGFNGPVHYQVSTSNFARFGTVSPSTVTLAPGASKKVTVSTKLPSNPGDTSASVQLSTPLGVTVSVPLTARTLIPAGRDSNSFSGVLQGGNGRAGAGGNAQSNFYYIDVPAGKKDLGVSVSVADPAVQFSGVLTSPDGQVYSYQSNRYVTAAGEATNDKSLQLYRRNPRAGRWTLALDFTNPQSGAEVSQPFTGKLTFNTVKVSAALPSKATLTAGKPVTVPVTVTNTGAAPLAYFVDGRLTTTGDLPLAEISGAPGTIDLPVPAGIVPQWIVPSESTGVTFQASATLPVNLDVFYNSGEPEVYSAAQGNSAVVKVQAPLVSPGVWAADIGESGPFDGPAPIGTVQVAAVAHTRLFDPAVTSSTGDFWQTALSGAPDSALSSAVRANAKAGRFVTAAGSRAAAAPAPIVVAPGRSATILVTITPSAPRGTTVRGHLYVDTFSQITVSGDELIDLPYSYQVG
ncbi:MULTISPECIES: S8 family serine peptidase [unclassified Actinoplanes]|uniref:S8 family serine peptidase n=1 Tax=unclassified Actinoplanes TaxID=2626549 RepID=UPI00043A4A6D|nr:MULTISPECIES: S8 family serine peptidase [unclassified Actinoplanes]